MYKETKTGLFESENAYTYNDIQKITVDAENISLKKHSVIINQCTNIQIPLLQVDVKVERESDEVAYKKIDLYVDHVIKEEIEIVIGPDTAYQPNGFIDASPPKKQRFEARVVKREDENPQEKTTSFAGDGKHKGLNKNSQLSNMAIKNYCINSQVSSNKVFCCNDCGKRFEEKLKLIQHLQCHQKVKQFKYLKCVECTYQTVSQDALKRHMKLHDRKRKNVCQVCGYRYRQKNLLNSHMKNVHSEKKFHECGICDYKTNDSSGLSKHLRIHSGEKPFSCSMCEFKCNFKCNLTEHLRIHSGEKPFSCPVCEYKSSGNRSLSRHLKIHTGEKPYSCSKCEYKCVRKQHLKLHMNVHVQARVKPYYSCSLCDHKCTSQSTLTKHLRIHTGEKYTCSMCEYKCSDKRSLTRHLKIHTGVKYDIIYI